MEGTSALLAIVSTAMYQLTLEAQGQLTANPSVKIDQAMKLLVRSWRKALVVLFRFRGYGAGYHRWSVDRWLIVAQDFAEEILGHSLGMEDLCGLVMLLSPVFGSKAKQSLRPLLSKRPISREDLRIYRGFFNREEKLKIYHTIFENNNKHLREKFFSDDLVRSLWAAALPHMTMKLFYTG